MLLSLLVAGCLQGCENQGEGKALQLSNWLKVSKAAQEASHPGIPAAEQTLQYALRKPQKLWLISYDNWSILDYDLVNVIDDKNILVARSSKYAKTKNGKAAETTVKLMSVDGEREDILCPSPDLINAPANSHFIDCVETSKTNKLTIKRTDFQGKLLQTSSMAANEWDDLQTQKNVAYYDEQQQAYVLETGKDNTYCRLIAPGKEKSLSFSLNVQLTQGKCDDMQTWTIITQKKLSKALVFGELGNNVTLWKKLEAANPGWMPVKLASTINKKTETLPVK
ncbi:hypothetical protein [Undibacterium pigrum]|uniref:Uncharacterized protein n=1 Tax=Undibacterium pigrum TaxID=401470 RepID=A0A318IZX9_9BURK|nr:hypothetical protein [Undibacterium pigrum]PXX39951.1 hypothetical protein DFR42_10962 [Undibacterium pigrum]